MPNKALEAERVFGADELALVKLAVLEDHVGRARRPLSHLVPLAARLDARRVGVHPFVAQVQAFVHGTGQAVLQNITDQPHHVARLLRHAGTTAFSPRQ